MFRSLRLVDAFEHLVSPEAWRWFGPMVARGVYHVGLDGWPSFPHWQIQAYPKVWNEAASLALAKLRSGEWVAEGISHHYGPRPIPIETILWEYLQFEDRSDDAKGAGFHFIAVTVSCARPLNPSISHVAHGSLRHQLIRWIRDHARAAPQPVTRMEQLIAARAAFAPRVVSDNLFKECRRAADLPPHLVQQGRPKLKGLKE